ncbi:MAG TPA: carboxypeptidase regulatory-like domain-containing protein [Thermoplasmatales archaeon]|nr:carboxypeptidase regulatory-like domain-containing protein [Thermoplasmatales archaeon]
MNYTLSESCDWVSVSPLSGNSSGEHDTITVSVDTTGLSEGTLYTCEIFISSNDGTGTFTVQLYVMEGQQPIPPTVEIVKPEKNKLYFRDKPIVRILRTLIIGPVTIQANATDEDGYIWKVDFFIDDTLKYTDYSAPYSWLWNETAFGKHTIKVRAYDNDGLTAEETLNVTIFNFGFGSVEEKGVVKGKVTEAGKMIKKGIPGVLVTASDGTNTTTGKIPLINRGKYSLQLTPGIYDITFEADGYVPYTEENVEVTAGDTVNLDVQLEPACEGC